MLAPFAPSNFGPSGVWEEEKGIMLSEAPESIKNLIGCMNLSKTLNRSCAKKTSPLLCEFDEGRGGLLPLGPCALAGGLAVFRPGIGAVPNAGLSATF